MYDVATPVFRPRRWVRDDIEWALGLGRQFYDGRYDEPAVRAWLHARLDEPTMIFLRTQHALGVAHTQFRFQRPDRPQAYLDLLYAEPGNYGREILRIMQGLRDWATEQKAGKFWFGDFTGHDMGALAALLGGRLAGHTYIVDLDGDAMALG